MSNLSDRKASTPYKLRLQLAAATVTLFAAVGSLAEAIDFPELWIASCVILIVGALSVIWLTLRAHRAEEQRRKEEEAEQRARQDEEGVKAREAAELRRLKMLSTTRRGRERVPRFYELSPYELGADPEASVSDTPARYFPRDRDHELRAALAAVQQPLEPAMVVLRGPSKAGKTRTLFEAVSADEGLRQAAVIAPHDLDAFASLLQDGGPPELPPTRVVVWLDDLERFVAAGHRGMHRGALDEMAAWDRPVVVAATAGGKGAESLAAAELSVPIDQLYNHPRVQIVPLSSELSAHEQAHVREQFSPDVAEQVVAHGIGEYLVAAPELARKLEEQRHKPGDEACPEGAAVAWAAIDWARTGMATSIATPLLRELWPHYLRGMQATDERFDRGLDWALKPIYQSVALVSEAGSYEAYDWIVTHADRGLEREINAAAWERMIDEVEPEAAFQLGVTAYGKGFEVRSRRAFVRGTRADDPLVAARSAFNLGYLLAMGDDVEGALAAYRQAVASGQREPAGKAAFNLGVLLEQRGDVAAAQDAYKQTMELDQRPQSAMAAFNLGLLLAKRHEVEHAREAYEEAIRSGDADLAARAAFALGNLFADIGAVDEARGAYERAIGADHPEISASASFLLGDLLERHGDRAGARTAFQRTANSVHRPLAATAVSRLATLDGDPQAAVPSGLRPDDAPDSAQAAFNVAVRLEEEGDTSGARAAYQDAMGSGDSNLAPAAAFSLAVLLAKQAEPKAAHSAYKRAIRSRHPQIAPAASFGLGSLLAQEGDLAGARLALEDAMTSEDADVVASARALSDELQFANSPVEEA